MYMTKEELRQHLLSAPKGTTPSGIVKALRANGVKMEGDPLAPQRQLLEPVALEEGASVGGFAKNVAKSAGRLAKNVGTGIANVFNPDLQQNTVANLGRLGIGAAVNAVETFTPLNEETFNAPGEQMASNLGSQFVDRYGAEGFGKTLYEDPVGAVSDAATAISGAGAVAKIAGKTGLASELGSLATAADPVANVSRVAGKAAEGSVNALSKPLGRHAERLYQSALKPTKAVETDFPTVVQTGLKNGIVLGKGSLDDVRGILEGIRQEIDDSIEAASTKGRAFIPTEDVISRMSRAKAFFEQVPGGSKFTQQLDDLAETFLKEQGATIPLAKAQTIKKNTYQMINDAYGQLEKAHTEGLKDIARGLKEEIVTKVPEIKGLNLKQSEMIGLEKALEDFMRRTGNTQTVDIGTSIGTATGMATAGVKNAAKAFATGKALKAFMDAPAFKSWRALVYYRLGKGVELSGKTSEKAGKISEAARLGEAANDANQ